MAPRPHPSLTTRRSAPERGDQVERSIRAGLVQRPLRGATSHELAASWRLPEGTGRARACGTGPTAAPSAGRAREGLSLLMAPASWPGVRGAAGPAGREVPVRPIRAGGSRVSGVGTHVPSTARPAGSSWFERRRSPVSTASEPRPVWRGGASGAAGDRRRPARSILAATREPLSVKQQGARLQAAGQRPPRRRSGRSPVDARWRRAGERGFCRYARAAGEQITSAES
jgi:hypothetical protein